MDVSIHHIVTIKLEKTIWQPTIVHKEGYVNYSLTLIDDSGNKNEISIFGEHDLKIEKKEDSTQKGSPLESWVEVGLCPECHTVHLNDDMQCMACGKDWDGA